MPHSSACREAPLWACQSWTASEIWTTPHCSRASESCLRPKGIKRVNGETRYAFNKRDIKLNATFVVETSKLLRTARERIVWLVLYYDKKLCDA